VGGPNFKVNGEGTEGHFLEVGGILGVGSHGTYPINASDLCQIQCETCI
jgi:hypothetical protein